MQTSPRSTGSDKLTLTLTGSQADRQDTFKNSIYSHAAVYQILFKSVLHNSGDIKV